jgi:hypothetical protein
MPQPELRPMLDIEEDRAEVLLERAAEIWQGLEGMDP